KRVPMPELAFLGLTGRLGLPSLPQGAIAHIKYPVVIDGAAFRKATGFKHDHDELSCIADYRSAFPVPR
ncbi:MAG: epimerase, partial [Deltaproteobacteria bacterium]|nr:epimerase [Deltaproteobacteria bacterium]